MPILSDFKFDNFLWFVDPIHDELIFLRLIHGNSLSVNGRLNGTDIL